MNQRTAKNCIINPYFYYLVISNTMELLLNVRLKSEQCILLTWSRISDHFHTAAITCHQWRL